MVLLGHRSSSPSGRLHGSQFSDVGSSPPVRSRIIPMVAPTRKSWSTSFEAGLNRPPTGHLFGTRNARFHGACCQETVKRSLTHAIAPVERVSVPALIALWGLADSSLTWRSARFSTSCKSRGGCAIQGDSEHRNDQFSCTVFDADTKGPAVTFL